MLEIVLVVGLSVMAFLLALLILPFVPRRISSFLVSLSHNISPVVRVVLIMLWLALLVKTFDSYKTMVKYEHQRHEKMAEISAKRDVLLHKFRAERNLYIECFAVVVTIIFWKASRLLQRKWTLLDALQNLRGTKSD
eukprot:TRINITY_DN1313_c0_g2_i5.p1 TRINITY_DN1313_c0_g2~~TRINITY_DN1313_c0_g2_i5.p1  ORF type:complete len:137 (+),score=16.89 TRINITY_DN1313_c0_g2_i5:77-487(+)